MTVKTSLYVCGTLTNLYAGGDCDGLFELICGLTVLCLSGVTCGTISDLSNILELWSVFLEWETSNLSVSGHWQQTPLPMLSKSKKIVKEDLLETLPSLVKRWTPALTRWLLISWDGVITLPVLYPQLQHCCLFTLSCEIAHFLQEAEPQQVKDTAFEHNWPHNLHSSAFLNISVSSVHEVCSCQCLQSDLAASRNMISFWSTLKSLRVISDWHIGQLTSSSLSTQLRQAVRRQQRICKSQKRCQHVTCLCQRTLLELQPQLVLCRTHKPPSRYFPLNSCSDHLRSN